MEVQDDYFLESVRWFKRNVTKNLQGNRLVVCEADYPKYKADRKRFESRQHLYLALGTMFVILSLFVAPRLTTLVVALPIGVLLYLLPFLNYTPKININIKKQHTQ